MSSKGATIDKAAGRRFALVRKHLGFDTVQMGEACSVSQPTISRIENGSRDIPQSMLKLLYMKYNISPIYIIAGGVSMIHKEEKQTLVKDIGALRVEIEIMKGYIKKAQQDIRILSGKNE